MSLKRFASTRFFALACLLAFSTPVLAQSTSATIRGVVKDDTGGLPGANIVAKEITGGFTFTAVTGTDGSFTLAGLRPGSYDITIEMPQYKPAARRLTVLVGQNLDIDFRLTADLAYAENVTVIGDQAVDIRTSTISTNITSEQIRNLPQNDRNFLNFAALAPGVKVNASSDTNKEVTSGALPGFNTNVFIDGVSYKNDILLGGVVGQDSSRGNPFPQNAVQEFRVLTQNFKAEFEKASSAAITAVTKSGGNTFSGDAFLLYQDKALVGLNPIARDRNEQKPAYERFQGGGSLGGPIVKDKMTFFATYELNSQNRERTVRRGGSSVEPPIQYSQYLGVFPSTFRSHLGFGKITYQPAPGQTLDVSYSVRRENEIKDFGDGERSFESAIDFISDVDTISGRHLTTRASWINEAQLTYQRFKWNTIPKNPDLLGRDYQGVIRIGGADTEQLFQQKRLSLRNDLTKFASKHAVKGGIVLSRLTYDVTKFFNANPVFRYRSNENFAFPFEASYGTGDPNLDADNTQFGIYLQDDWQTTPRLTINAGIRWDYETNQLNNDYVTPQSVIAAVSVLPAVTPNYFTDGSDRPSFKKAIQPRLGFSYDLSGSGKTVIFGGIGRYYDRVLYNQGLDERFRLQFAVRTFRFSADGAPRDGNPTLVWQDSYLSQAALDGLIANGTAGEPEVFLIDNDTEPPFSDQFTVGLRHQFGNVVASLSYLGVRSKNGFTFVFGNRRPENNECCQDIPTYSNVLLSQSTKKAWYNSAALQLEKPFTSESKWGAQLTYTLGKATENGGDLFSLDYISVDAYPRHPTKDDERHRIVATGIYQLPAGFRASAFVQLASGVGYTINDRTAGDTFNTRRILLYTGRPDATFAYKSVDLRVDKEFRFGERNAFELTAQVFNVFNSDNYTGYDGGIETPPAVNLNFGKPNTAEPARRLQFGASFRF